MYKEQTHTQSTKLGANTKWNSNLQTEINQIHVKKQVQFQSNQPLSLKFHLKPRNPHPISTTNPINYVNP